MAEEYPVTKLFDIIYQPGGVEVDIVQFNGFIPPIFRHRKGISPFAWSSYIGSRDLINSFVCTDICKPAWGIEGKFFLAIRGGEEDYTI